MKILIWTPLWPAHGDPLFYRNCLRKHLIPQANLLASNGCAVDLVLPELLASERGLIQSAVQVLDFSVSDQLEVVGSLSDPSLRLYKGQDKALIERIACALGQRLSKAYDAILLWETPVPFFEKNYPEALIVHQMPGAFSRPPYPHTVTFDPVGLYKQGSLYRHAEQIISHANVSDMAMAGEFSRHVRSAINALQPFTREQLTAGHDFRKLSLLPLQVSAHYTFEADTPYDNQADFLLDVLQSVPEDHGVIITQYVTPRVKDTVLTEDIQASLSARWKNMIFRPEFDSIANVSQYLVPLVDEVITCSSSLGLQAMAWSREITVRGDTFLSPYATSKRPGIASSEVDTRTLAFLLGQNQPLASAVINDAKFLLPLLEEMVSRKRAGAQGLNLMPRFEDIDANYAQRLFDNFTIERAVRDVQHSSASRAARQVDVDKYRRLANEGAIQVLSFDVFDTLIKRPTEVPADAFKLLEHKALELTDGAAEDFARVRENAENQARTQTGKGEITLDDVYAVVQSFYGFDTETIEQLKKAEIALELSLIQARPFGRQLWTIAVDSGKPIYLASDMYLPQNVLEQMLDKAGYRGYRKLFVSSAYGVRKKEGGLYEVMLGELQLPPSAVLHSGDNRRADIEQAEAKGMKTYRLPRSIDRMRSNTRCKELYPIKESTGERARSAIAGLTAHALFDASSGDLERNTLFQGNPQHLGYAALGPMLTGYVLWLGRQARRDGISRLFFLSREGWILKQIYEAVHAQDSTAVPAFYLYASRRATRVASLISKADVLALAGQPYQPGIKAADLLSNRFGLPRSAIPNDAWSMAGYSGPEDRLEADPDGRVKFAALCSVLSEQIVMHAATERSAYLAYLEDTGLKAEERPAIVDIGWRANMQGALGVLLQRPLDGYYYATLQGAERWKAKGHHIWAYAGDMLARNHPSAAVSHRQILEYLTCHVEASLVKLQRKGKIFVPVFRAEEGIGKRRLLIEAVHQGAIQFAIDFRQGFGDALDQMWIDPFLGERVFADFVKEPAPEDAMLLLAHHVEDALGGINKKFIIAPASKNAITASVWEKGARAVHNDKKVTKSEKRAPETTETITSTEEMQATQGLVRKLEERLIGSLLPPRKLAKYKRSRDEFFLDSNSALARAWFSIGRG